MSVLLTLAAAAPDPVCTSAAECSQQGVYTFIGTPQRIWATVAAFVSIAGVVIGWLTVRAMRRTGADGRRGAIAALAAGLIGALNAGANLAISDGGLGTGNGVAGSVGAVLFGLVAISLGVRALRRSRVGDPSGPSVRAS